MSTLAQEAKLLQQLQKYPFVPRLYASTNKLLVPGGSVCPGIVMQILGPNVTQVRKAQPDSRFEASTACHIGLQMLSALEAVHREGFIHRDVKPSNFVVGYEVSVGTPAAAAADSTDSCDSSFRPSQCLFVLDYGLCRQYASRDTAAHKPSSGRTAEFRGTSMYASLNSHSGRELTRRDDLWSLMYVVADLVLGGAPWRKASRVRLECERQKRFFMKTPQRLFAPLAPDVARPLLLWHDHMKALKAESTPDYALITRCLSAAADAAARLEAAGLPTRAGGEAPRPPQHALGADTQEAQTGREDVMRQAASAAAPSFPAALKAGAAVPFLGGQGGGQAEAPLSSGAQPFTPTAPSTSSAVQASFDSASAVPTSVVRAAPADVPVMPPPHIGYVPPGYFDLRRVRFAADEVLHSRGGCWQPKGWTFRRPDGSKTSSTDAAGLCEATPPAVEARGWGCTGMQLGITDSAGCPLALRQLHAAGDGSSAPSTAACTQVAGQLPLSILKYSRAAGALLSLHAGTGVHVNETTGQVAVPLLTSSTQEQLQAPDCPGRGPLPSYVAPSAPAPDSKGNNSTASQSAPTLEQPQQTAEEILHAGACKVAHDALQRLGPPASSTQGGGEEAPRSDEALYVAAVDAVMAAHRSALTLPSVKPAALAAFRALASHAPAVQLYAAWVAKALDESEQDKHLSPLEIGALLRFREMQAALRVLAGKPLDAAAASAEASGPIMQRKESQAGSFGAVGHTPGSTDAQDDSPGVESSDAAAGGEDEGADVTLGEGGVGGGSDTNDSSSEEGSPSERKPKSTTPADAPIQDAVAKAEAAQAIRAALLRSASFLLSRVMYNGQAPEAATVPYVHAAASACGWMDGASPLLKVRMLLRQLHLQSTSSAPDTLAAEAAAAVPHCPAGDVPHSDNVPPMTGKRLHKLPAAIPAPPPSMQHSSFGVAATAAATATLSHATLNAPPRVPPPPHTPPPGFAPGQGAAAPAGGGWRQAAERPRQPAHQQQQPRWQEHPENRSRNSNDRLGSEGGFHSHSHGRGGYRCRGGGGGRSDHQGGRQYDQPRRGYHGHSSGSAQHEHGRERPLFSDSRSSGAYRGGVRGDYGGGRSLDNPGGARRYQSGDVYYPHPGAGDSQSAFPGQPPPSPPPRRHMPDNRR